MLELPKVLKSSCCIVLTIFEATVVDILSPIQSARRTRQRTKHLFRFVLYITHFGAKVKGKLAAANINKNSRTTRRYPLFIAFSGSPKHKEKINFPTADYYATIILLEQPNSGHT